MDRRDELFERYADRHASTSMSVQGLLRLCDDLAVEPDSYEVLLFCYLCRAKEMYRLTRDEFLLGLKHLGHSIDTVAELRRALFTYNILPEQHHFYLWTFHYGLTDGQRCLSPSNAISLWRLFYSKNVDRPSMLDAWFDFLERETPKMITCDTWKIFPQWTRFLQVNGFAAYDENEAWPCLFDGFVEDYLKTNPSRMS